MCVTPVCKAQATPCYVVFYLIAPHCPKEQLLQQIYRNVKIVIINGF